MKKKKGKTEAIFGTQFICRSSLLKDSTILEKNQSVVTISGNKENVWQKKD